MTNRGKSPAARIIGFMLKGFVKLMPLDMACEFCRYIPGYFGGCIRGHVYKKALRRMGRGTYIHDSVAILFPENIEMGDDVSVNQFSVIHGMGGVRIGSDVRIGYGVKIISFDHVFSNPGVPIMGQGYDKGHIDIGDDVWIGANAVILKGVKIGRGSVIGAGSVVTGDIPPFSIAVGAPAKVVKKRR
jgi:acetyltransferase-like isoleucine patch superfamily enzyme